MNTGFWNAVFAGGGGCTELNGEGTGCTSALSNVRKI